MEEKVKDFVKEICIGRDDSHGFPHMSAVASLALEYAKDEPGKIRRLVWLVGMLHDVPDHKYDHDGSLEARTRLFLTDSSFDADFILKIIERISFSRERDFGDADWLAELGEKGILIRNYVSDADKYFALGDEGFERCKTFTEVSYFKRYGSRIPADDLKAAILKHAKEKLLRLVKDGFFKTEVGLAKAMEAEEVLRARLDKL